MKTSATVLLGLLFCAAASAHAQGIEWETLNDEVMSLYRQGQYERAVVVAKKALEVAEEAVGPDHPSVAASLENMAELYRNTCRDKEAEALEKRAKAIRAIVR